MNRNFGFLAKKAGGQGTVTIPDINISRSSLGNVITFNVDSNLPSGQQLFYTLDGNIGPYDVIGSTSGNLTLDINGNASVDVTANLAATGNVAEFYFNLRKTSISGDSLSTSDNVVITSTNAVNATGGTKEQIGNVIYHTFNASNSSLNISNTSSNAVIQFLIVGRGGRSGTSTGNLGGGGGGAGQVIIGKMWAMNNTSYTITPASSVTNQSNSTVTGNIIIAYPTASNTFASIAAISGGQGGNTTTWSNTDGYGQGGGSGGGAGTISNNPAGTYRTQLQGFAGGEFYPNLPDDALQQKMFDGNVTQYWNISGFSSVRNGGSGGGGAGSVGSAGSRVSSLGPAAYSELNDGGNGGNGYVWLDGVTYAAGGPGYGWLGDITNPGSNGTTQASIAGAGGGPGVPTANTYGLVKFVYEFLPRIIQIT